jgi:hypothetical protein
MKSQAFVLATALALISLGCKSDETAICERLDECNLLPSGTSVEDCEEDAEDIDDTEDCLECVEDEDCDMQVRCLGACET